MAISPIIKKLCDDSLNDLFSEKKWEKIKNKKYFIYIFFLSSSE